MSKLFITNVMLREVFAVSKNVTDNFNHFPTNKNEENYGYADHLQL